MDNDDGIVEDAPNENLQSLTNRQNPNFITSIINNCKYKLKLKK